MTFSVNTNAGAMIALQNLRETNARLEVVQRQISTGLKVSSAKDNGAIYAIAQGMRAKVAGYNAVKQSLDRGTSVVDVAIAASESISDILIEMRELDSSIDNIGAVLARLGSASKRLDIQSSFTDKLTDALEKGIGNLVDVDMAKAAAELQALQVKQQLGIQALSIANRAIPVAAVPLDQFFQLFCVEVAEFVEAAIADLCGPFWVADQCAADSHEIELIVFQTLDQAVD